MEWALTILVILFYILFALALIVASVAGGAIINGFVLRVMWGWFIVPVFHLPLPTLVQAMGLCLIVNFMFRFSHNPPRPRKPDEKKPSRNEVVGRSIGHAIGTPLMVLLFGWVLHRFFM